MSTECTHTLDSGNKCHAPARTGSTFCHHHTPRIPLDPHPREIRESEPVVLPPLNDKSAVLVAVTEIVHAASERRIKFSEARTLLMGLKLAARLMTELDAEEKSFHNEPDRDRSWQPAQPQPPLETTQSSERSPAKASALAPDELEEFTQQFQKAAVQHLRNQTATPARKSAAAISDRDEALIALAASSQARREQQPSGH